MAILKTTVLFWAFVAGAHFLLALWLVASDQWGNVVHIAWLTPGATLLSWRFLYFAIVSVVFVYAGIVVGTDSPRGMKACSAGFILGLLGFDWFAVAQFSSGDVVTGLLFFVLPALVYAAGARNHRRAQYLRGAPS